MSIRRLQIILIYGLLTVQSAAQGFHFNVGGGPGFPMAKTSDFVNNSYNLVAGAGPNLRSHLNFNGEFMFHGLPVQRTFIDQLDLSNVKGRFYSLTGNLVLGSETKRGKIVYLIAGGGWYRRTLEAKQRIFKTGEKCEPGLAWWDIRCVNGVFPTDVTVGSRTLSAGGFNVGAGFDFPLSESRVNLYTEVRYHRAFTADVETSVLPLTFGVRW